MGIVMERNLMGRRVTVRFSFDDEASLRLWRGLDEALVRLRQTCHQILAGFPAVCGVLARTVGLPGFCLLPSKPAPRERHCLRGILIRFPLQPHPAKPFTALHLVLAPSK